MIDGLEEQAGHWRDAWSNETLVTLGAECDRTDALVSIALSLRRIADLLADLKAADEAA